MHRKNHSSNHGLPQQDVGTYLILPDHGTGLELKKYIIDTAARDLHNILQTQSGNILSIDPNFSIVLRQFPVPSLDELKNIIRERMEEFRF